MTGRRAKIGDLERRLKAAEHSADLWETSYNTLRLVSNAYPALRLYPRKPKRWAIAVADFKGKKPFSIREQP